MKVKYVVGILALMLGMSSCVVSKRKYDALNMAKQYSDRKVRNLLRDKKHLNETVEKREATIIALKGKLREIKEEFSNLKYDMSASNAKKSSEIDNLMKKLDHSKKDQENIQEKTQELEGDLDFLRKVRQQNTAKIDSLEVTVKALERDINLLNTDKESAVNSKDIALQKVEDLTSKVDALNELLKREKGLNSKLQEQLKKAVVPAKKAAAKKAAMKKATPQKKEQVTPEV